MTLISTLERMNMTRGETSAINTKRTAPNGYQYTKTETGWRLSHHIIAEAKLGRPLRKGERVVFRDGDRKNLKMDNIEVVLMGKSSVRQKIAQIDARILELQAKRAELVEELSS